MSFWHHTTHGLFDVTVTRGGIPSCLLLVSRSLRHVGTLFVVWFQSFYIFLQLIGHLSAVSVMVEGSRTVLSGIKIRTFLKNAVTVVCCSSVYVKFAVSYDLRPFLSSFSLLLSPSRFVSHSFSTGRSTRLSPMQRDTPCLSHLFPGFSLGTLVHLSLSSLRSHI